MGSKCQPEIHLKPPEQTSHEVLLTHIHAFSIKTNKNRTHPAHGLGDGLHHAPDHAPFAGRLVQSHHDVVHGLLHQLGCFRDGIVGVGRLGTQSAD